MADDLNHLDSVTREAMAAYAVETAGKRASSKATRSASEVINQDAAPRPYSVRLTAREIHRLRVLARACDMKQSEMARQFILDGLLRLEAKLVDGKSSNAEHKRITEIKLAILNAYDLVESLGVSE
jgi:hypothetical protein